MSLELVTEQLETNAWNTEITEELSATIRYIS